MRANPSPVGVRSAAHSDRGAHRLLTVPWVYGLFGRLIGRPGTAGWMVEHHIRPVAGSRILDLGCGPGSLVEHLPESVAEYCGVDINPAYIEAARSRWAPQSRMRFICADASTVEIPRQHYDIVTAIALLHHLDDAAAEQLLRLAHDALVPGGRLVTWDCAYLDGQHPLARFLISKDRGRAVRTDAGYRQLAQRHFAHVESRILHDTLRVPYTISALTCAKGIGAGPGRMSAT